MEAVSLLQSTMQHGRHVKNSCVCVWLQIYQARTQALDHDHAYSTTYGKCAVSPEFESSQWNCK